MNPQNPQDPNPSQDAPAGLFQKLLTGTMFGLAFLVMLLVKPAQYLKKQVYETSGRTVAWVVGVLAAITASIATGYFLWLQAVSPIAWISLAIAALFGTYYYLWPVLYLIVFRWAFEFSRFLWRNVPAAKARNFDGPVWFSQLLAGLAIAGTVISAFLLAWHVGHAVHHWLDFTSVLGNLIAIAISVVAGVLSGIFAGFVVISILIEAAMPVLAIASGVATAWHYNDRLVSTVASYDLPTWSNYVVQAAVVFAVAGYVFPLVHLLTSRVFNFVGKYLKDFIDGFFRRFEKLLTSTYADSDSKYVSFLHSAGALALTYSAGQYVWSWAASYGLYGQIGTTAGAVLVAYLLSTAVLSQCSNVLIGIAGALAAFFFVYVTPWLHVIEGGWFVLGLHGLVGAALAFFVLVPIAYQLVKLIANPLLASWLSDPLSSFQRSVSREIFSANSNTYSDSTGFEPLFAHLTNLLLAVSVFYAVQLASAALALSSWVSLGLPVLMVAFSYLFGGKLLLRWGNHLIGGLVGIAAGVFVGVEVFAHYGQNYWYAIPAFAAGAALTVWLVFPVLYVLFRALANAVAVKSWLLPATAAVYNFCYGFVASFWTQFMAVYRRLEASFKPAWDKLSRSWDESWAAAKAAFDKAMNQSKKK
jgi:hypothetical protein